MRVPERIHVHDTAFAFDGGSTHVAGTDEHGEAVSISLDWSMGAQEKNATRLMLGGAAVEKRSEDERRLLEALATATYERRSSEDGPRGDAEDTPVPRFVGSPDIGRVLQGIGEGPESGMRAMVAELIRNVQSDVHVDGKVYTRLSDVLAERAQASADAFRRGDFAAVVELLEPYDIFLSPAAAKRLEVARRRLETDSPPGGA